MDSDSEMEEETIHLEPLIKRVRDSLKSLSLGRVSKVDSSSPVVESFHRHFEIVCRLLSIFEQCGPSSGPFQKSMEYSFIHSFLCLLSRFNELSTFFKIPSNLSVEKCKKAFPSDGLDLISLSDACSTYLQDNHKSELEMKIPIETIPPSEYLEESVLKRVIDKVYSIVKRYLVPSGFDGKGMDDQNLPILSNDLSQFGNQTLLDDPTVLGDLSLFDQFLFNDEILLDDPNLLDPFVETSSTSLLPSSSSTFLNPTQLENTDGIPSSSEPPRDPLYLPHPTSFSSVALSKSNESDSHFEEERSMVENRGGREMDAQNHSKSLRPRKGVSSSVAPSTSGSSSTRFEISNFVHAAVEGSKSNESDSHFTEIRLGRQMVGKNRARSHRPLKRDCSSSSGRKKVAPKIQKTPSRDQIAIDDSHLTPPTSLNRSFSSSGHPISTEADNPISSEYGDVPLTDENLILLKTRQGLLSIRYQHFFKHTTAANPTCLLCNQQVRSPEGHISLHLTEAKQTLKQLLGYCCDTGRAPPIMNAYTIAKLINKTFDDQEVCPVCFMPSGKGWTHLGDHMRVVHLKHADRSCKKLDTLVMKCFVSVSIDAKRVKKYSCTICGSTYKNVGKKKSGFLHKNIEECLRLVPNSEKSPLVDLAAVYEWFLNESKDGKCPHCKNKIKDFGWQHFNKCRANYTCGVEVKSGSTREICPDCHIPFGCEDFLKAHSDSCDKLRDVNTRFCIDDYCDRIPGEKNKAKCSVTLDGTKCGEICWTKTLPSHLAEVHQIEGIKDENWILCDGKCWCQWCGEGINRFQHQKRQ